MKWSTSLLQHSDYCYRVEFDVIHFLGYVLTEGLIKVSQLLFDLSTTDRQGKVEKFACEKFLIAIFFGKSLFNIVRTLLPSLLCSRHSLDVSKIFTHLQEQYKLGTTCLPHVIVFVLSKLFNKNFYWSCTVH